MFKRPHFISLRQINFARTHKPSTKELLCTRSNSKKWNPKQISLKKKKAKIDNVVPEIQKYEVDKVEIPLARVLSKQNYKILISNFSADSFFIFAGKVGGIEQIPVNRKEEKQN